jgi:prefoldin alpha subunit
MDKALQEKYFYLQQINMQTKQLEEQLQQIDMQAQEMSMIRESLSCLPEVKNLSEILIPLGNGIFAKGNLKEKQNLIVSVGAGVAVEKSFDDAIKVMESQINELKSIEGELLAEIQRLSMTAKMIEQDLMNAAKE